MIKGLFFDCPRNPLAFRRRVVCRAGCEKIAHVVELPGIRYRKTGSGNTASEYEKLHQQIKQSQV